MKDYFTESNISISKYFQRLLILFAVSGVFILFLNYKSLKTHLAKDALEKTLSNSIKLINKTDETLIYAENTVNLLARNISKTNSNNLGKIAEIMLSATPKIDYERHNVFTSTLFGFVNNKDQLIATSNHGILDKPSTFLVSKRPWVKNVRLTPWRFQISKSDIGIVSKDHVIPIGFGITNRWGKFVGSIALGIHINRLRDLLILDISEDKTSFAILNSDGSLIVASDNFIKESSLKLKRQIAQEFSLTNDVTNGEITIKNQQFFYSKIPHYPQIGILVANNNSNIYVELWPQFLRNFKYLTYLFLLSLVVVFLLKRKFINPIIALNKTANKISAGNLKPHVIRSNLSEVNSLSNHIKKLKMMIRKDNSNKILFEKDSLSKKDFMSSLNHEFSNVTHSIMGISEFIKSDIDLKLNSKNQEFSLSHIKEYREFLDDLSNLSEESLLLVQDIIDINYRDSGLFEIEKFEKLDLENLTRRVIKILRVYAIKKRKTIITDFVKAKDCDFRVNHLSAKLTKQILTNSLRGIIKYSQNNNKIDVSLEAIESEVSEILRDSIIRKIKFNNEIDPDHRENLLKIIKNSRPKVAIGIKARFEDEERENLLNIFKQKRKDQSLSSVDRNILNAKYLTEMQGGVFQITPAEDSIVEIKITF